MVTEAKVVVAGGGCCVVCVSVFVDVVVVEITLLNDELDEGVVVDICWSNCCELFVISANADAPDAGVWLSMAIVSMA